MSLEGRAPEPRRQAGRSRKEDNLSTRENILDVATAAFASEGLAGARIDAIAERTRTSKQMIYYHFGSKEGLYKAVLQRSYARVRRSESEIEVLGLPPDAAMRRLIEHTFDHHRDHPEFVRLVAQEDLLQAQYLRSLPDISEVNRPVIRLIERILLDGQQEGAFRRDVTALDLHLAMSSLSYFRVASRHTFGTVFGCDLDEADTRERHRGFLVELIMGFLKGDADPSSVSDR